MEKLNHRLGMSLAKLKDYYLHFLAASLTILLILLVYWRDLEILTNEALNTEALTHVFLMPFFIGFLLYRGKNLFKASIALDKLKKPSKMQYIDALVGLSLCLISFLIYWYGSYTFYPLEYHLLSLPIFVLGVILILFNMKALKALIFPALFLLFLTPLPNEFMYLIGGNLANFNTQASYALLKPLGFPVTLSTAYGAPTLLLTTSAGQPASFTIDLPCSGIYTLTAFVMFAAFLALIVSTSILKKLLIFTLGFAIFAFLNIIRITTIILAAYFFGEETAMLIFHTIAGLILIFVGMLLTLFTSEKLLKVKFFPKNETLSCMKCEEARRNIENFCLNCGRFFDALKGKPSRIFWAKLIILLLAFSTLALSVNAPAFAIAQGQMEVTSTWENTTHIFPQIPGYDLKFLYRDTSYERIAKQDASLTYAYFPVNTSGPVVYLIVGVADSISNLHSWEVCLISLQTAQGRYPLVTVIDSRDIQLLEESFPLIARYLVFRNQQNYTQVTLYWFEKATFKTGITIQPKYVRLNLIILTKNLTKYQEYESLLKEFGKAVALNWQPIKSQSLFSLGVPAQQALLILLIAFIIAAKTNQYFIEWRKKMNNLKIFSNFASPVEKLVFQTATELSGERKTVTARDINLAIKRKTGKFMKGERLMEVLNRLEEYNLIKKDLVYKNNTPTLVWKS